MSATRRPYRSIYAYPWDVLEETPIRFVETACRQGLSSVTLALSYHAGKFLRPRSRRGRVYFPEDGAVYFEPTPSRYGKIRPCPHPEEELRRIALLLSHFPDLELNGWVVLFHNSRLGLAYPEETVHNAWGDSYPYSLCPVNPHVAEYGVALLQDIAATIPLSSVVLETAGFLPYAHGYHHEFAQVRGQRWLEMLLGLCFCDRCLLESHRETGIDSQRLRREIAGRVDGYLDSPVEAPSETAEAWIAADILDEPELAAFIRWRRYRVSALVQRLRAALPPPISLALIPTVQRPTASTWVEGTDLRRLAGIADYLEIPFYEPTAADAIADAWDALRRSGGHPAKLRAILRPGPPDLNGGNETAAAVRGIAELGISDFAFYNWGLLRKHNLDWIAAALKGIPVSAEIT